MNDTTSNKESNSMYDRENREAEKLLKQIESPNGAEKLGEEVFKHIQEELQKSQESH